MKGGKLMIVHKKCLSCPYYLKTVKCVKSPCPDCLASGSAKNPFGNMADKESKYKESPGHK